jgi:RHH-type proline utilization regulon transcriptional repressor/proline dehydrogenase/delta 1-pyrroline-5-carboxylate dehydrogenase
VADHAPSLVAQLIAALATDNRVLLGGAAADVVMHALPQTLAIAWLASPVTQPTLNAVLFEGAADSEAALRAALAERDGPLVALHVCVQPTEADLYRLVAERTVSVNTTAAGGNASLMTIGD